MNRFLLSSALATLLSISVFSVEPSQPFGVVNFSTCISDSKLGQQEQASFESLKKQMTSAMEDTEKQLTDLTAKFNDPDYLDGLSPEAEDELKTKYRTLNEDLNRYQNQYYQVMNQANMRIVQNLSNTISTASEKVAKDKKLALVLNKETCFYYQPSLDVTKAVIDEMDKSFVPDSKKPTTPPAATEEVKPDSKVNKKAEDVKSAAPASTEKPKVEQKKK